MTQRASVLGVVVLAAGAGSRFGDGRGGKLLADLAGRPLLAHVLDEIQQFGPVTTVVVLGAGAEHVEGTIGWVGEMRVHNYAPERGLASSIQVGVGALEAMSQSFEGAFIVLGDQPRLRVEVMQRLAQAAARARTDDRIFVVPRYTDDSGPRNPVLMLRPAWPLVANLTGDHGLGSIIEARPDQVLEVPVEGAMPDVDRPADLERLRDDA